MRFDGKIRQNRICGKLIQTQKIILHGSRRNLQVASTQAKGFVEKPSCSCERPVREFQFPNQLKNRESPAMRDLRFAPTSFRTPKTTFSTVPKACGYLENKKFEGR